MIPDFAVFFSRSNVKVLHDGRLLYTSGGVCVLHDTVKNEQSHFTGHDDMVNCISVHPHSVGNVAASGQIGDKPKVCLWHTKDPSKPLLTLSVDPVKEARGRDANAFPRVRKLGAQGQVCVFNREFLLFFLYSLSSRDAREWSFFSNLSLKSTILTCTSDLLK